MAHAAVRFFGTQLDPIEVTRALLVPPDKQNRAAEPWITRGKGGRVMVRDEHKWGRWSFSSKQWVRSNKLESHVIWLLAEVEPRWHHVSDLLQTDVRADIFCFSSGTTPVPPSMSRETRSRADALGLPIEIDHYGPNLKGAVEIDVE